MKRIFAFLAPAPAAKPSASGADLHRRAFLTAVAGGVALIAAAPEAEASPAAPALPSDFDLDGIASDYALRVRIRWARRRRSYRRRSRYGRRSRRGRVGRFRDRAAPVESSSGIPSVGQTPSPAPPTSPAGPPRIRFN